MASILDCLAGQDLLPLAPRMESLYPAVASRLTAIVGFRIAELLPARYRGVYAGQDEFAGAAQALRLARDL